MVRYWMHNGLMRASEAAGKVGGRNDRSDEPAADVSSKISRSKGAGGLAQLIEKQTGERLRFFLLRTHYRSTNVFGDEPLEEAGTALDTFYRLFQRYERIVGKSYFELEYNRHRSGFEPPRTTDPTIVEMLRLRDSYLSKMDDDFNTGGAVSDLFELARCINRFVDSNGLEEAKNRVAEKMELLDVGMKILRELSAILGLFVKPVAIKTAEGDSGELVAGLMQLLIDIRANARKNKDFGTADVVRNGLTALKISIQDLKEGTTWERAK